MFSQIDKAQTIEFKVTKDNFLIGLRATNKAGQTSSCGDPNDEGEWVPLDFKSKKVKKIEIQG